MRHYPDLLSTFGCGFLLLLFAGGYAHAQSVPLPSDAGLSAQPVEETDGLEMDIQQADAFIQHVFSETEFARYDAAAQVYLWLLEQLDQPLPPTEEIILDKHLWWLSMVMPASEQARTGLDSLLALDTLDTPSSGIGARLAQWWRRQDPLPGTTNNERVEEHLTRVAFASHKYQQDQDERGFDDRGEIYVRLGKPSRSKSITLRSADLLVHPHASKMPDNEFWVYKHIDYDAHYVFLRNSKTEAFTLGYSTDLIPPNLRNGKRKTPLLLHMMEEIYAQLALEHGYYGKHYDEIANYRALPPRNAHPPHLFALRTISLATQDDQQHEYIRTQTVPATYTATRSESDILTVPVRWARFLDADGTTRTEFYWGLEAEAMKPSRRRVRRLKNQGHEPSDKYLISMAVAQRTADFQHRALNKKHYLVPANTTGTLPTRTFIVQGDTSTYHLAVQWDQQWTRTNDDNPGALMPGATLKIGTQSIDSMQALHHQGHRLEMSDLKPQLVAPDGTFETATPYPYARLTPETPLALYFELYHLTFGSDDQTHYTIEYTVAQKQKRRLLPFTTPREGDRVGARSSYTGAERTTREYIMLDLTTWTGKGEIEISLRATDETTGHQITRTIPFMFEL